jgi:hypothetical protein
MREGLEDETLVLLLYDGWLQCGYDGLWALARAKYECCSYRKEVAEEGHGCEIVVKR